MAIIHTYKGRFQAIEPIEDKFHAERKTISILCYDIRKFRKVDKYKYNIVINHFSPGTKSEYDNVINLLMEELQKCIRVYERTAARNTAIRGMMYDPEFKRSVKCRFKNNSTDVR